jgi:hypothetical protein
MNTERKPTFKEYIRGFFEANPGSQINVSNLAARLRELHPNGPQKFVDGVVGHELNRLATDRWLLKCGKGEYRKAT